MDSTEYLRVHRILECSMPQAGGLSQAQADELKRLIDLNVKKATDAVKARTEQAGGSAVRELRADHGIEPTLSEILWLHELGKIQEDPVAGERLNLMRPPVKAGAAYLWPFTIMASVWFNECAVPWFKSNRAFCGYALAFALAHGRGKLVPEAPRGGWLERIVRRVFGIRESRILFDLIDRADAKRCVKRWVASLACSTAELEAAVDEAIAYEPGDEPKDTKPSRMIDWVEVAQDLATLTGTDPTYWLRQTSKDSVARTYLKAMQIDKARAGMGCAGVKTPLAKAIQNIRAAMVKIIEDHKKKVEGGTCPG